VTATLSSSGCKPNPQYYAIRLRNIVTKEMLWIPQCTPMARVMEIITNESCSNPNCPNKSTKKSSPSPDVIPTANEGPPKEKESGFAPGHSNGVWKVELRVRYIPKDFKEIYEKDRATLNFFFNQVREDFIQSDIQSIDQDVAIQLCCLSIRHYYKDANRTFSSSDRKNHLDYVEKELGFSNFIPKCVIDTIKHKNLKKLVQNMYKKIYSFSDSEYILKYFELLGQHFAYDHEKFVVTLGWNIEIDLIIGPNHGISYLTHAQAKPTKVTDFETIKHIKTCILGTTGSGSQTQSQSSQSTVLSQSNSLQNSKSKESQLNSCVQGCGCKDIKSQLRIQIDENCDDLAITCLGVNVSTF
jgi:focal adhesion kinase 1